MKIATVTWVTYNNYGTLLQAYSLQKKLDELGAESAILCDRDILIQAKLSRSQNSYYQAVYPALNTHSEQYAKDQTTSLFLRLAHIALHPRRILRAVQIRFCKKRYHSPYTRSQTLYEEFKNDYLNIFSKDFYKNIDSLNQVFDAFIAGSDQIWSVSEQDFNPYYFLDFVQKPKIAYAPSIGTTFLPTDKAEQIKMLLSDFSAISVREQDTAKQLSELLHRKVEWVADPTLLHNSQFWSAFTAGIPVRKKPYLLCYFLENKDWYFSYAKQLAKQLHLSIVLLPNKWDFLSSAYVVRKGVGPKEFVSLIQHAEFVLTDSYHGSIFSLIFNRNFLHLLRFSDDDKRSQNIRIYSLFNYLRIDDRIVTKFDSFGASLQIENYSEINKKIEKLREKSIHYLQNSLASVISTGS